MAAISPSGKSFAVKTAPTDSVGISSAL